MAILVTGTGPHSIGESLVALLLQATEEQILAADVRENPLLRSRERFHSIEVDLNPLVHSAGCLTFFNTVSDLLLKALVKAHQQNISCVVQGSGVYKAGRLADMGPLERINTFGVNLLGHAEVLAAVMQLNSRSGTDNSTSLIHVDIGSFQGLKARADRSIYISSKAAGVSFAASLAAGRELYRSIYLAPGPVDTHMLHYNHWVVKAGGSEAEFGRLKAAPRDMYRSVLVDCSDKSLHSLFRYGKHEAMALQQQFERYKEARAEAHLGALGIISPEDCAQVIHDLVTDSKNHQSGVYLVGRRQNGSRILEFRAFEELDIISKFGFS